MNGVPSSSLRVKATTNPCRTVTQSVRGACRSQMYVTPSQHTILTAISVGDSWICRCVWTLSWKSGLVDERYPCTRDGAAVFAQELQRTDNNSMGMKSYLNQRAEGFIIDD